jgi:ferredoxin-nitrite reductase
VLADTSDSLQESLGQHSGKGHIDITNRANVQIRGVSGPISAAISSQLRDFGLAARLSEVDQFRNVMASPTAGIDLTQLMDTRPLVRELDKYLSSHLDLTGLSPKFSIGLDGGEQVSIRQQLNDVRFTAIRVDGNPEFVSGIYLYLSLAGANSTAEGFLLKPEDCLPVVAALIRVYLDVVANGALLFSQRESPPRKPRLKQVLEVISVESFCDRAQTHLSFPLHPYSHPLTNPIHRVSAYYHLGIHPQRQSGFSYIGIALPLGRLKTHQLRQLAGLSDTYGSSSLRLTPWRSLLLPDIANAYLPSVQQELARLDLSDMASSVWGGLITCAGSAGCAASATDTHADAIALAQFLEQNLTLDLPVTIHFSGCSKSCAHHASSDITLEGTATSQDGTAIAGYHLYVGEGEHPFGRQLAANLLPTDLPQRIVQMLSVYQLRRKSPYQSFREFVNQYPIAQLQSWFATADASERLLDA